MIKLRDWDRLYVHNFDWVLRRLSPDCLNSYHDTAKDWQEAVLVFNVFQTELFRDYGVNYTSGTKFKKGCVKGLELTAEQLFDITHKYINQFTNYTVRSFIFHWWSDLRHYIEGALPPLDQPWLYYKPATKEEIEYARKEFSHIEEMRYDEKITHDHTFKDDAQVLEYRGERYIIDSEWGDAWTKNKKGEVRSFQLQWDWWYPIDEYIDLYNI